MRGLRNIVQKIPDKYLNWGVAISVVLALFAYVDIETLKKIELLNISNIANTVYNFAPTILGILKIFFSKSLFTHCLSSTLS